MKKSLIALAVLGSASFLFAGTPAMAQSSVTLYGVADAGVGQIKSDGLGQTHGASMLSSDTMNNGNSRLGVRGVEDLGSGLKVGFNFEDGLSLKDGHAGTSGGQFWSRQANVWVGGQFGQFTMGRAFNPGFLNGDAWELTDYANYSVVGASYGFSGEGPRSSSQFRYDTPTFAGLTGRISYITHADNTFTVSSIDPITGLPVTSTVSAGSKVDAGGTYINGPISVGLDASKAKSDPKMAYGAGVKYSFLNQFRVATSFNATPFGRRGVSLGGTYYTGPFSLTLDVTRDTHRALGQMNKHTNEMLEGKYALSKRTFVYAAFLHFDSKNNYGLGIRHNF